MIGVANVYLGVGSFSGSAINRSTLDGKFITWVQLHMTHL